MDEYNELQNVYFGKIKMDNEARLTKSKGLFEYVNLLNPPEKLEPHVNYRLLWELAKIFKEDRIKRVMKKLIDYGVVKNPEKKIEKLIELAGNYADDFDETEKIKIEIDEQTKKALKELSDLLIANKEEDIQNAIYQIAKSHDIQPRDFFQILYKIILNTTRGPKIGSFIADIGAKKVGEMIRGYVD